MKAKIILLLLMLCTPTLFGQVPEMSVRDSTLLRAIDMFLDSLVSNKLEANQVAILAVIRNLETRSRPMEERSPSENIEFPHSDFKCSYKLVLRAQTDPMVSNDQIASCKFTYRGREVYIFFGAEFFVKYTEGDRKKLSKSKARVVESGKLVIGVMQLYVEAHRIRLDFFAR